MALNFWKEAQSTIDFATYCPTLYKATADNDSIIPGYLLEEINIIGFLSHQHRVHLIDFLLTKLQVSGWSGKQKVVRILMHLSTKGHFGVRILLRLKDGELRKAASQDGPSDPVLANTPRLFCASAIQELLTVLFDPETLKQDEEKLTQKVQEDAPPTSAVASGYGSHGTYGKYEGFGSTPIKKPESFVNQVCDLVGKITLQPTTMKTELASDSGNYTPLPVSNLPLITSVRTSQTQNLNIQNQGPPMYSSIMTSKVHVAGKAGGGWESDEESDEQNFSSFVTNISRENDSLLLGELTSMNKVTEEDFLNTLLSTNHSWPIDLGSFLDTINNAVGFNRDKLLLKVKEKIDILTAVSLKEQQTILEQNDNVEVLPDQNTKKVDDVTTNCLNVITGTQVKVLLLLVFIEFSFYKEILLIETIKKYLENSFGHLSKLKGKLDNLIVNKAIKLNLICNQ